MQKIIDSLGERGLPVLFSGAYEEGFSRHLHPAGTGVSCVLLGWNSISAFRRPEISRLGRVIDSFREINSDLPVFLWTDRLDIDNIPLDTISKISGYIWKNEDTPGFIAGRIENAARKYIDGLLPPFCKALFKYAGEYKYSWHTPGHMGGLAFLNSPAGRVFYEFFGEKVFRSDLSVSVPGLGSLLDHTGVLQEAEDHAARVFGADRTYFVTNGTSTSNKIVLQAMVKTGDIVLVDRNCHKSVMQGVIMTGAVPVYLRPSRNSHGIIGPIRMEEFSTEYLARKIKESPLLPEGSPGRAAMTVITNSTYDGLCYNVGLIMDRLKNNGASVTENLLFDEAWFAHARFNPIYSQRYASYYTRKDPAYNIIFATQSTHKLLAAFSQASMIHVMDQRGQFSHDRFKEAYLMHSSTSPQYGIIASLDMAARMMEGELGRKATQSAIEEANSFRKKMARTGKELKGQGEWWFDLWQPDTAGGMAFHSADDQLLNSDPMCWVLRPEDKWHGFAIDSGGYTMLDPVKVTVLTPGVCERPETAGGGIPAPIVSKFLNDRGIVAEKTGFYSFLFLFSIGVTSGKSGTLLAGLFQFKRVFDEDLPVQEVFPHLARHYAQGMTIQGLCREMHRFIDAGNYFRLLESVSSVFPAQAVTPAEAYRELVKSFVRPVKIADLAGKTSAVMVVPYPPGIPVVMPGEKFNPLLVEYLQFYKDFNSRFAGFENELHGVKKDGGEYYVYCIDPEASGKSENSQ